MWGPLNTNRNRNTDTNTNTKMNMNMNTMNSLNNPALNFSVTARGPATVRRRPMRVELTDEQKAEIREAFEIFDMDKDGALDFHEFKVRFETPGGE